MAHLLLQVGKGLLKYIHDCVFKIKAGVLRVQVRRKQELGKLKHCFSIFHLSSSEVSVVLIGSVGSQLLEGKSLTHAVVVMEHAEGSSHLLGVWVVKLTVLVGHDGVLCEVCSERQSLGEFVDDAD